MAKSPDFFRHHRLPLEPPTAEQLKHKAPVLPYCVNADSLDHDDCLGMANPAWRDNGTVFCRACAPLSLKNPGKHLKELNND